MPVTNGHLKKVIEAWPVLTAVTLIMTGLLTAFAEGYIGDVMEHDIAKTDKIIEMDDKIQANTVVAHSVKGDTEDIKEAQVRLEAKLDRLIEIMLTDD